MNRCLSTSAGMRKAILDSPAKRGGGFGHSLKFDAERKFIFFVFTMQVCGFELVSWSRDFF